MGLCTRKLQVTGNYPWLANKMLLCRPFKPKLSSDGCFPSFCYSPNHSVATVTSTQAKKSFQADQKDILQFQTGSWQYEIRFNGEISFCFMCNVGGI